MLLSWVDEGLFLLLWEWWDELPLFWDFGEGLRWPADWLIGRFGELSCMSSLDTGLVGEFANSFVFIPFCLVERVGVSWLDWVDVGDDWLELFLFFDELLALLELFPLLLEVEYFSLSFSSLRKVDFEWGGELVCDCGWAAVEFEETIILLEVEVDDDDEDSLLLVEDDDEAIDDEDGVKIALEPFKFVCCWVELTLEKKIVLNCEFFEIWFNIS